MPLGTRRPRGRALNNKKPPANPQCPPEVFCYVSFSVFARRFYLVALAMILLLKDPGVPLADTERTL